MSENTRNQTQPPADLVADLKQFDPTLRIRWGGYTQMWFIERQMPSLHIQYLREKPNPYKSPRGLDVYAGWKEGFLHVLTVAPELITNKPLIFETLRSCDSWRVGGMEKLSQELDRIHVHEEGQVDRAIETWNQSASREMHDQLQWRLGNRISMRPDPTGITSTDQVEHHEGFTVVDKRM